MEEFTFSVAELAQALGGFFRQAFPDDIWVTGQISNLKKSNGGHRYFDLVEPSAPGATPEAKFSVTLFQSNRMVVNKLLKRAGISKIEDGMEVRIRCVVDFYPKQGRLQLRMTSIDPTHTLGQMAMARQQLLEKLSAEGIFALQAQLTMDRVPRRIGLVTSIGSAAHADFTHELTASGLAWEIYESDARVQGEYAEATIIAGLLALDQHGLDVIALVRGGGSRGDLTVFDSEAVVRCLAGLSTPVFTGIGHEVDRSICDEAAFLAFKTPTACAAALSETARAYHHDLEQTWARITERSMRVLAAADDDNVERARRCSQAVHAGLARHDANVVTARRRLLRAATVTPQRAQAALTIRSRQLVTSGTYPLRDATRNLDRHIERLATRAPRVLERAAAKLDLLDSQQRAYDPRKALARGWSITRNEAGAVIRTVDDAPPGSVVTTDIATGRLTSRVESVQP